MRLPFALTVALLSTLSLLAGCVEPVTEGGDPDATAAVDSMAEAARALTDESGHIAGTVTDAAGLALAGAHVVLDGAASADTDDGGRFAFVDVAPGDHVLTVTKAGYLDAASVAVPVDAKAIARPAIVLAEPVPEAYNETTTFTAFVEASAFGGVPFSCHCWFDVPLATGATEAVLEVVNEGGFAISDEYRYTVSTAPKDENGTWGYAGGWMTPYSPARVPTDVLADAVAASIEVVPEGIAAESLYTVYVTVFYNGPAPDGFTAVPA
jgi:hypothetical protein